MAMADHTPSSEELSDAAIKSLKAHYSVIDLFNRLVSFNVISGGSDCFHSCLSVIGSSRELNRAQRFIQFESKLPLSLKAA